MRPAWVADYMKTRVKYPNLTVGVVGLGYVGLPLAVEFGKAFSTVGYDLSAEKVSNYQTGLDPAGQISREEFGAAEKLEVTSDPSALDVADFIIVAVPTPVDVAHRPDFGPLASASETVGRYMKSGCIVIYESTVYPGATEEIAVPILERSSGKKWKTDFHVGYSPERINPGDREHTLARITKVVAGDDTATLDKVAELYASIVDAGVYRASSIMVAEAAKVIENTQRDLNIALMNELAILFKRMGLDTSEVLAAAGTKWNFLPFKPGLVGGHCIGVDPYYLTHKAEMLGYHPQVILAGRRINDGMGKYVAEQTVKQMIQNGGSVKGATANVLGLTFKEDCPDLRNSRVIDVIRELESFGVHVVVHDPVASYEDARREYGIALTSWEELPVADATVVAVAHREFRERPLRDYASKTSPHGCFVDVKAQFSEPELSRLGLRVWRL